MIIILDYGSRFTDKIEEFILNNNIKETKILKYIPEYEESIEKIIEFKPNGIIISGSPCHIYLEGSPKISTQILELEIPILGICYGLQLLNHISGGIISKMDKCYKGSYNIQYFGKDNIFKDIENNICGEMSHRDKITTLSPEFICIAETDYCIAAIKHKKKNIYGVQYHPEITNTNMNLVIRNFIELCK